jgi:MobA/MobL family.
MASYHLNAKIVSKGKGQSACASASYIAGEKIKSEVLGQTFNNIKPEVKYSNIMLCKNAPEEYKNRETLWNAVEKKETNKNAQLARMLIMALPVELDLEQQIELVNNFAEKNFVSKGMIADINIHDKGDGNPHAHIMLTLREIDENGNWKGKQKGVFKLDKEGNRIPIMDKKTGEQKLAPGNKKQWAKENTPTNNWNRKETLVEWREDWADQQNKYLDAESQVDHRTLASQGIDREPTRHVGYRGGKKNAEKITENEEIQQLNAVRQDIVFITQQVEETEEEINQRVRVTTLKTDLIAPKKEVEDKKNDTGRTGTGIKKRDRILPTIVGNDRGNEAFVECQRQAMAAISGATDNTISAADTADEGTGKTISGFDLDAIQARGNIAATDRANRDAKQPGLDAARKITSDRQREKRITDFAIKYGIDDRQGEKDDRQME